MSEENSQSISIRVVDQAGNGIADVVVGLDLSAKKKNSYDIGMKVTDPSGRVSFSREEIERQILLTMKASPMDYSCYLKDCPEVTAFVPEVSSVERFIEGSKLWGIGVVEWRLSPEQVMRLRASKNDQFVPVELHAPTDEAWTRELVLALTTKD